MFHFRAGGVVFLGQSIVLVSKSGVDSNVCVCESKRVEFDLTDNMGMIDLMAKQCDKKRRISSICDDDILEGRYKVDIGYSL